MEESIDQNRDQLCRLDDFQRGADADAIYGRVPPELMYMMDEFALSIQQKILRNYEFQIHKAQDGDSITNSKT